MKAFFTAVIIIAAVLLLSPVGTAASAGQLPIEIEINGAKALFTDAQPYIDAGRTMVPLRFISENLGAGVDWDGTTRTVTITRGVTEIKLQVGSSMITVNGAQKQMDTRMVFHEQFRRNYVPLRFVSENLGSDVGVNYREGGTVMLISIHFSEKIRLDVTKRIK